MKKSRKHIKTLFWSIGITLAAAFLVALGWFLGRQNNDSNPYQVLKGYESSRHGFMVKSAQLSVKTAQMALRELKNKNINKAIEDCYLSIDLFPIDAKPYILLTKIYLMTRQEQKMYDTLSLAGRSYPNFNNIVGIIDDEDLDKLPLEEPQDAVYLANFPENKRMAMSFMFDDGEANIYKALPAFDKYGYKATIPVVAGFVSDTSNDPFWGSWAQWKDAAERGFEIANHSMYHRDVKTSHGNYMMDEAKEDIEAHTGRKVTAFVFPHDSYTDEAVKQALKHHEAVRTAEFLHSFYNRTVQVVLGGPYVSVETADRLVDIAIKRRLWLIAKCHGVTDKRSMRSFKSITPDFLEKNLAYIHSKSGDTWVDTFTHVFEYLYQRAETQIETTASTPGSTDFILRNRLQKKLAAPLTVVVKTKAGVKNGSAYAGGRKLKAWPCGADILCIDVDAYDINVHVQWD
jgi:peptidoglycan/xylan/chitin deacetylase (PgdA/CDA1 family)